MRPAWRLVSILCLSAGLLAGASARAPGLITAPRLQGALAQLVRVARLDPQRLQAEAALRGVLLRAGRVRVVVEAEDLPQVPPLAQLLKELGAKGVSSYRNLLQAHLPLSQLIPVSHVPGVRYVRLPYAPKPAAVVSEGVALIGAGAYHRAGFAGRGVKVAIVDLGFEGLSQALAEGELPESLQQFDYTGSGMGGIAHGTAVAEIVHDVAPGAQLLLMKVANEVDLGRAVEDALRQGVKVINHSVVWYNTEFGDGRGEVSQVAEGAVARGAVWVNAAGNNALQHWKGPFRDRDDDSWVEFNGAGDEALPLQADAGQAIEVFLTWDAWPQTSVDYDLYLGWDANGNGHLDSDEFTVSSTDPQRGPDPPTEHLTLFAPQTGQYLISVWYKGPTTPPPFEVFTAQHTLRTPVRQGSVLAPATAPSVLAVGAVNQAQWSQGAVQPFSGQGPTQDGRVKPDLLAPDQVSTFTARQFPLQFGQDGRFVGTSAASPHVAGAAALLFEESPGLTARQAALKLTRDARDVGPRGPDDQSGYGQVQLRLEPSPALTLELSEPQLSSATVETGQTVSLSVRLHNPHDQPAGMTLAFTVDGAVVAVREVILEPDQRQVVAFSWTFARAGTYRLAVGGLPPLAVQVVEPLQIVGVQVRARDDRSLQLTVRGRGIVGLHLELYDLAGRRVALADSDAATLAVPLRTPEGAPLANGVYLVALSVRGGTHTESLPLAKLLVLF